MATDTLQKLRDTATATISTVLRQKGLRSAWLRGPRAISTGQPRIAGPAFTVRFVPAREDISTPDAMRGPGSFFAAIETMPPGCVVVCDAMGELGAGFAGDVGCARMQVRKVAGLVTDGAVRDVAGLRKLQWPVWSGGVAAPPSLHRFHCADTQTLIACGGVAVAPDDVIVADDDGAIVVPGKIAAEVAQDAWEKEQLEDWILGRVQSGEELDELYPPTEKTVARFKATLTG
jgi:regulator of RNase E activity RraA